MCVSLVRLVCSCLRNESARLALFDWITFLRQHFKNLMPLDLINQNKEWFQLLPNRDNPQATKYKWCLCSTYFSSAGLLESHRNALATEEGVMYSTYEANCRAVSRHRGLPEHIAVVKWLQQKSKRSFPEQLQRMQRAYQGAADETLAATANMIRTVYAEAITNVPFISHPVFVTLQKLNGATQLGNHHNNKQAAVRMVSLISATMHRSLLHHLTETGSPVTIIVDGSTDFGLRHYLILYLQAIENSEPRCYFYKLIELHAETARGMFQSLQDAFSADEFDFIKYLKSNLVGFASDGAAVMTGRHGGLQKLMSTGRRGHYLVCIAWPIAFI